MMNWVNTVGFILIIAVAAMILVGWTLENPGLFVLMLVVFWHFDRRMKDHVKEHHKICQKKPNQAP